jgi:hypothetical protein
MKIRLYLDEDSMDGDLIQALRARGLDVESALEAGMVNRSDAAHLEYATGQSRVLFSFNVRDFNRLHGEFLGSGRSHAGIIVARQQQFSVGERMRRLLKLVAAHSSEDMKNRIEFLGSWG